MTSTGLPSLSATKQLHCLKFSAFAGALLTPNAWIKIGRQSQLPVKTIYLRIQVFRKHLKVLYITFSFAFLKSACVTFICCSRRVNRPASGVCRWPSCQHLKIRPWSKTLPNWHHLTRSFGMCEWIVCMWQNNRHEETQFITESHIQFSHTSKEIICLQNLSTFFSPHKPVSHAVCEMSILENKTRDQQSKTRTQERLN